jgi:hypothetical protein
MPFDATCKDCWNHADSSDGSGQCRALPPTEPDFLPTPVPTLGTTVAVRVKTYKRTADTLPACGLYRPLVEPEVPPPETKAEQIERLRRDGIADVAAIKRILDGR